MEFNFSESISKSLELAESIAKESGNYYVYPAHLLLAILKSNDDFKSSLENASIDTMRMEEWATLRIKKNYEKGAGFGGKHETFKRLFDYADLLRIRYNKDNIDELLILASLSKPDLVYTNDYLRFFPAREEQLLELLDKKSGTEGSQSNFPSNPSSSSDASIPQVLDKYCTSYRIRVIESKIGIAIGRSGEINRILQTLQRFFKPNVILRGEGGVGKTAIIEGLAYELYHSNNEQWKKTEIFELDLGSLVAGASYKGEIEDRIKKIIASLKERGNAILFIDEIHALLDEKSSIYGLVNYLKPVLARGELKVIGATTKKEYRLYIEKDVAFSRRFSLMDVEEPSIKTTVSILESLLPRFYKHYSIRVEPDILSQCPILSKRYFSDRFLPDSAIDLLDLALTSKNVSLEMLNQSGDIDLRSTEERVLLLEDLTQIIAERTGIQIGRINLLDSKRYQMMEEELNSKIIGQNHASALLSESIIKARQGLKEAKKPIGSFLFLGGTGTGKTEMARVIADILFGTEDKILKFDMSEYMEAHSVAKLKGSPPGYVGYEQGGVLVNKIRMNPYSVLLFDEIEKAHSDVFKLFLQVLEDGILTDSFDNVGRFNDSILIFTSNLESAWITEQYNKGIEIRSDEIISKLINTGRFLPEFLNRFDAIIPFAPITIESASKILKIQLKKTEQLLNTRNLKLTIDPQAIIYLTKKGFSQEFGARPLKRVIETDIISQISKKLLSNEIQEGNEILVSFNTEKNVLVFTTNSKISEN